MHARTHANAAAAGQTEKQVVVAVLQLIGVGHQAWLGHPYPPTVQLPYVQHEKKNININPYNVYICTLARPLVFPFKMNNNNSKKQKQKQNEKKNLCLVS